MDACAENTAFPWRPDARLDEVEQIWIQYVLKACNGNRTHAARQLGIDPSTLWRKLKEA
jgi:DNA-binding NtrC family response regulator